jgi:hypothetical protein
MLHTANSDDYNIIGTGSASAKTEAKPPCHHSATGHIAKLKASTILRPF